MISWLITDLRFIYLIIPIVIIWFITFTNAHDDEYDSNMWLFVVTTILGCASIFTLSFGVMTVNHVSESNEPWRQVYGNELDAPVLLSTPDKQLIVGKQLSDDDRIVLYDMVRTGNAATVTIGEGDNLSKRTIRVTQIEGDLKKDSVITKIEYRKATTFHYHVLGLDGNSQPADNDGDIRITIGRPNNTTNNLFGD